LAGRAYVCLLQREHKSQAPALGRAQPQSEREAEAPVGPPIAEQLLLNPRVIKGTHAPSQSGGRRTGRTDARAHALFELADQ
jgi:hypothetical protein